MPELGKGKGQRGDVGVIVIGYASSIGCEGNGCDACHSLARFGAFAGWLGGYLADHVVTGRFVPSVRFDRRRIDTS